MHSESPPLEGEMLTNTGVRQMPGIDPGTTGSTGGSDGLGVSKFSAQQDAAKSWSRYNFGFDVTKAAALTVVDADGNPLHYPVARTDVLALPEVQEAIPLLEAYAAQRAGSTALWPTPYDCNPIFNEVVSKMISGDFTAAQAHAAGRHADAGPDHQVPQRVTPRTREGGTSRRRRSLPRSVSGGTLGAWRPSSSRSATRPASTPAPPRRSSARRAASRSTIRVAQPGRDGAEADARSILGVLGLGVGQGDRIRVTARGDDADEAIATLAALVEGGARASRSPE